MTNIGILGNPSSWAVKETASIPAEYVLPKHHHGIRLVRRTIKRQIDTTLPATPSTTDLRFKIPASSVITLDFRKGGVHVVASVTVNAPWSARMSNFAWNMFNRFRLEQHNQYIEDKLYFNYTETYQFWTTVLLDQFRTTGVGLYGAGSPAVRNAKAAGWEYILPIPTDCLCRTVMPWFQMINVNGAYASSNLPDVWMIWNVADPTEWIEVYGGVGAVTGLTVESGNTGSFLKTWHTDVSPYPRIRWSTYQTFIQPLTTALSQTINIDAKVKSLQHITIIFRKAADVGNPQVYDKFETWLGPSNPTTPIPLLEYQFEVNNQLWPDSPISLVDQGDTEPYKKSLELFGNYHTRFVHAEVTAIGPNQFNRDKFFIAYDANQYPFSPHIMSPVSTENSTKAIILRMKFTAPPPAGLEIMIHTKYWRQWLFAAPSGKIVDW